MGSLIPGEAIIYERNGGSVFARYRDPPYNKIPRWYAGGTPDSPHSNYNEWKRLVEAAEDNDVLKKQLDKLMVLYYTIKDPKEN